MPTTGIIAINLFKRALVFVFATALEISFRCRTAVVAASTDNRVAVAIAFNANIVEPIDSDAKAPIRQKTNTVFLNIASTANTSACLE
jgi:hypothetical protein